MEVRRHLVDAARQLEVVVVHLLHFFILLFFLLLHSVLMLLGPIEEGAPSLVVSDLKLAEDIVIGYLQNTEYFYKM